MEICLERCGSRIGKDGNEIVHKRRNSGMDVGSDSIEKNIHC